MISEMFLPQPNKTEQDKIAEVISTVDRAIEQTEMLIAKQQSIKTGLMHDLLTRGIDEHGNLRSEQTHPFKDSPLGRIPVEWEVAALSSAVKLIKRGPSLSTNSENRGIIYLTSDNISETGELIWQTVKYLDARPESLNSILEIGDVILNCVNSEAQIGKTGFVDKLIDVTTTGFNNFGLSFKEKEVVPKFVFYQLTHENFQRELRKKIKPAINQSSFSSTDIADLPVVLPRLEEQQFITDKIGSVSKNVRSLNKILSKVTKLKIALMQDLLTGKKRVTALLKKEVSML
jgi:type I restriction enzyme S subunit